MSEIRSIGARLHGRLLGGVAALAIGAAFQPALAQDDAHYGGTMKLLGVSSEGTLDPHINYTARYWPLFIYTHDGLMAFKKVGGADSAETLRKVREAGKTESES